VVGVERITSLQSWGLLRRVNGKDATVGGTDVFLLGAGSSSPNPFAVPRVAFDVVGGHGLSFGGSLGYLYSSVDRGPATSLFVFAPRIGYLWQVSEGAAVWLRGGVTYSGTASSVTTLEGRASDTLSLWNITLEPHLVLVAAPRIAFTLGPLFELGLAGSGEAKAEGATRRASTALGSSIGFTAGLSTLF
jgi:hypothetical protein